MHRTIGQDHVIDSIRSFLRSRYPFVGSFVVTSMDTNVPNPFEDTWDYWGTHMIRVFGSGQVSWTRLGPYTSVPFELALYASKDGEELRYNGRVCGGGYPPAVPEGHRGQADVVRA